MKKAIISGITGQDGSYLAELLLSKGYTVYGITRRERIQHSMKVLKNISHLKGKLILIYISISDYVNLHKQISMIVPDEFYHLAAESFVNYDMLDEANIMNINFNSTLYISNALKEINPQCKIFFAGSSEMFGNPNTSPQNEQTKFNPRSMYGIAKLSSYYVLKNYRETDNMFTSTGIMYNHESPRRGSQYVTKKIVSSAIKIKYGLESKLSLGNIDAKRDWGYAPDYVYAMWMILQQDKPDDYVIATGRLHSVKYFAKTVFKFLDLDYKDFVEINKDLIRPSDKISLCGDAGKLKKIGWKETKTMDEIIIDMINTEENIYKLYI